MHNATGNVAVTSISREIKYLQDFVQYPKLIKFFILLGRKHEILETAAEYNFDTVSNATKIKILLEICATPFLKERLILGLKSNILNQLRILAPMFLKHPLIKLLVLGVHLLFSIRTNQPDAH